jgi:phosphopantetheinyl transferase
MPLFKHIALDKNTQVGIWKIEEPVEELKSLVNLTNKDLHKLESFKHQNRKKEWLCCRILTRELTGEKKPEVNYNALNKPFIDGHFISFSHTFGYAAVITSKTGKVAIDIEKYRKQVIKVKHRFLSTKEIETLDPGTDIKKLSLLWSAKESLYKIQDSIEISFLNSIYIANVKFKNNGIMDGTIGTLVSKNTYPVYYLMENDYVLTYIY